MTTKQTDTVAMTEEQLDGVSGGPHYSDWNGSRHNVIQRRRSNRTRYTSYVENDNAGVSKRLNVVLEDVVS